MTSSHQTSAGRSRAHGALATQSRVQLLDLLRASASPLDVHQLSTESGLHPNTVRFHLDVLVEAGLALGRPDPRGAAGRPRLVYSPTTHGLGDTNPDGYELLAEILAGFIATGVDAPARLAEQAGRTFADRQVVQQPAGTDALGQVAALFAELGFEPETHDDGEILLHACPFRAVARRHPDVVCSMHLGLLERAAAGFGAPHATTRLEPFVAPELCIAYLEDPPGHTAHSTSDELST